MDFNYLIKVINSNNNKNFNYNYNLEKCVFGSTRWQTNLLESEN